MVLPLAVELNAMALGICQENFFRNFGSILMFTFIGTTISAVGVGGSRCVRTELCLAHQFQVQCPRLHIFVLGTRVSGHLLARLWVHAVCDRSRYHFGDIPAVQGRPEALHDHLW